MTSESQYRRFAVASLKSTEGVTDLSNKVGLLIRAEAWLDLGLAQPISETGNHGGNGRTHIFRALSQLGL